MNHTRGSHADDFSDTELCYCDEEKTSPSWEERFDKECVGMVNGQRVAFIPLTKAFIAQLLKEENSAWISGKCCTCCGKEKRQNLADMCAECFDAA